MTDEPIDIVELHERIRNIKPTCILPHERDETYWARIMYLILLNLFGILTGALLMWAYLGHPQLP